MSLIADSQARYSTFASSSRPWEDAIQYLNSSDQLAKGFCGHCSSLVLASRVPVAGFRCKHAAVATDAGLIEYDAASSRLECCRVTSAMSTLLCGKDGTGVHDERDCKAYLSCR